MNNERYNLALSFWTASFQYLILAENVARETASQDNVWVMVRDFKECPITPKEYEDETRWSDHTIIIPLFFNLLHGIELLLKGFLLVDPAETIEKQHNICELRDRFKAKYPEQTILNNFFDKYTSEKSMPELLAAAYAPVSVIRSLTSSTPDPTSVSEVDRSLVRFLYGNRVDLFGTYSKMVHDPSDIPSTVEEDWNAKNIITLIDKAAKQPEFQSLRGDYNRLCEYLHPNFLSSFCLTEPFLQSNHTWIRIHRSGDFVTPRAVRQTVEIMAEWTDAMINLVNSVKWPFGAGPLATGRDPK